MTLAPTAPSKALFRVSAVVFSFRPVTISVLVSSRGRGGTAIIEFKSPQRETFIVANPCVLVLVLGGRRGWAVAPSFRKNGPPKVGGAFTFDLSLIRGNVNQGNILA